MSNIEQGMKMWVMLLCSFEIGYSGFMIRYSFWLIVQWMRILRYERRDEGSTPSEPATGAVEKGYFVCRRFEPCFRPGGIAQLVEQQCLFRIVALLL